MYDTLLFELKDIPENMRQYFDEIDTTCQAPYRRVVEREPGFQARRQYEGGLNGRRTGAAIDSDYRGVGYTRATTLGWAPTCTHDAPVIPCTVLDPFGGSGTSARAARALGRKSIIIELSADYCELTKQRLHADLPLFQDEPISTANGHHATQGMISFDEVCRDSNAPVE